MLIRLTLTDNKLLDSLSAQPETGMGFQDVWVTLKDDRIVEGKVFNGTFLESSIAANEKNIKSITVKNGSGTRPTEEFTIQ